MSKIKEMFDSLQDKISEAVATATKESEINIDDVKGVVENAVAELAGKFDDYLSPEEVEAKAEELATQKIEERDALAAKIADRVKQA